MSTNFFASQKAPANKSIITHFECLLGNIVLLRPADIDNRWHRRRPGERAGNCRPLVFFYPLAPPENAHRDEVSTLPLEG